MFKAAVPSPTEAARFIHECGILKKTCIEVIVRVLDVVDLQGSLGLVLEDFPSESLGSLLGNSRVSIKRSQEIAVGVAEPLARLHEAGITHGNVNPDNILLGREVFGVKLTDFGIAREITHEARDVHHPEAVERYLPYISPEQSGWTGRGMDWRSDFCSFGVTLYQALTGLLPFLSNDPLEMMRAHVKQAPASPSSIRRNVPGPVSAIVMNQLAIYDFKVALKSLNGIVRNMGAEPQA